AARQHVIASAAVEKVIASAAVDHIVATTSVDDVISRAASYGICECPAGENIVAFVAFEDDRNYGVLSTTTVPGTRGVANSIVAVAAGNADFFHRGQERAVAELHVVVAFAGEDFNLVDAGEIECLFPIAE